jgi:hypothetical protein
MEQVFPGSASRSCTVSVLDLVYFLVGGRTIQSEVQSSMKPFLKGLASSKRFGVRL